ncbi:hypothetical protein GEMRC1_013654 [Eukaryota sp. GEM-RC1]
MSISSMSVWQRRFNRLKQFNLKWPIFALILFGYFFITAGIIYDQIVEPPSIGSERDPATGAIRPIAVLAGRLNGQYVIEGFSAAFFMILGCLGLILLDLGTSSKRITSPIEQKVILVAGGFFLLMGYNILIVFLKKKMGHYLVYQD